MKKLIASIIILFFICITPAFSGTPTITWVSETDTTVTYLITDSDGIREISFIYTLLGEGVTITYATCPKEVTVTVSKKLAELTDEMEEEGELPEEEHFSAVSIEDCSANIPNESQNEVRNFSVVAEGSIHFELQDGIFQVDPPPTEPPSTPIGLFVYDWWIILFIVWIILTFYLLWWRIFGPLKAR